MDSPVGFVGLGNMGSVLASNLVTAGLAVVAHDLAGPARCPDGATWAARVEEVAAQANTVVLSLPDGKASEQVAGVIVAAAGRRTTHVIDTSTIGVSAADSVGASLNAAGVSYVDAPVSGGVAGARARTLVVMYAAPEPDCAAVDAVLAGLSDRRHRVGDRPGMAQALKLANNFLSAIALAATSEAVSFGVSLGLDMATMLEVLNTASGQSQATSDKFPKHVLTGRYAAGFSNSLMSKDLQLYLQEVHEHDGPAGLAHVTAAIWEKFATTEPGADFTRIFPFVDEMGRGRPAAGAGP
jgi:3-hydroxyisobutyrate dehydrogenase-like beta-hydroxyacid dehydrogenase